MAMAHFPCSTSRDPPWPLGVSQGCRERRRAKGQNLRGRKSLGIHGNSLGILHHSTVILWCILMTVLIVSWLYHVTFKLLVVVICQSNDQWYPMVSNIQSGAKFQGLLCHNWRNSQGLKKHRHPNHNSWILLAYVPIVDIWPVITSCSCFQPLSSTILMIIQSSYP